MKTDSYNDKSAPVKYWDKEANGFDRIYAPDGSVKGVLNRIFRRDMEGRFRFALARACVASHPDILEIGCGSGVHTRAFLDAGASTVTGVDLSPRMLAIASERLSANPDYAGRATLIKGDFMSLPADAARPLNRTFDAATIIGVFDYIADPEAFLKKALELAPARVIATFPRDGTLRSHIRRVRLSLKGCPVYFYSRGRIEALAAACGASVAEMEIIGQLYCAEFNYA
ncbi:SAM-dependent methyltransferase [Synergistales bacterium]|nr:SAM-dependent methyltransferase [Synergistales bacterium]